ncbi:MAG TPA: GTP-binding protein, partial [Candidatus Bathyarchaeota archaeon]|nr:GTP-binding protein [Candidatus Bathyarchaeota archaeon]
MPVRQPIVCVLGHIDVGKTLLLDKIRKTSVQAREAGGITQHIGASFFPMETLMEICGPLIRAYKGEIKIPGLLIIDTPGHEVFANLRRRGGSVADIAILVIDVMEGFQAQTYECLNILE